MTNAAVQWFVILPNTALGAQKRRQMIARICILLFLIHKSIAISATGTQNVATEDSTHEINFVLMLDGKEVPIVRSDNVHTNLIERNRTLVSLCEGVDVDDRSRCLLSVSNLFENTFTVLYVKHAADITAFISSLGYNVLHLESSSEKFLKSLKFKQNIMRRLLLERLSLNGRDNGNDKKFHFCEIGFNSGQSSLFWLLYDDRIHVTSFDIGNHKYVHAASRFLNTKFPNRFRLILGDSTQTLPKFRRENPSFVCDLWFIDGGHSFSVASSDLANALAMSYTYNKSSSRELKKTYIIVDDIDMPDVRDVWSISLEKGFLANATVVHDSYTPCVEHDIFTHDLGPCIQCLETGADKKYPLRCRGANLTHITVGAGVALPVPTSPRGATTQSHIKSMYPVAGAATAYPIFVNKMDTIICAPFHLNLTDTVENRKRLDGVKSLVHDFFINNGFFGLQLENATEIAFKDLLRYFSGYPIRALQKKAKSIGCPDPEQDEELVKFIKKHHDFKRLSLSPSSTDAHTTFAVAAQFKNEACILKEWLDHYIDEGCSHFFLINNNSTDNYLSILSPYISKGLVTLFSNPAPKTQILNLNQYVLPLATLYTFIIPVDLDEFIYARNNYDTIRAYLSSLPDCVAAIAIPTKYFGTNGQIKQPDSVIYSNVRRRDWAYGEHDGMPGNMGRLENVKTIVRSTSVKFFSLHRPTLLKNRLGMPVGVTIQSNNEYEFPFYKEFNFFEGYENATYLNVEHLPENRLDPSNETVKTANISTCVT